MKKLKVVLVGDAGSGKTSLLKRYCDGKFVLTTASPEIEFERKDIKISGECYQLIIWDLPGQHRFRAITPNYFRRTHGVILVYDVTNRNSFDAVNTWFNFAWDYCPEYTPMILVGNKSDQSKERQVTMQEGLNKAENFGLYFVETSAKDGENVADAFRLLAEAALENSDGLMPIIGGIELRKNHQPEKSCCEKFLSWFGF